jgi:polysaccharide deacetylase family protein (PEP-CTERM system associated)
MFPRSTPPLPGSSGSRPHAGRENGAAPWPGLEASPRRSGIGLPVQPLTARPGTLSLAGGTKSRCAFTIDVEDWYQSTIDFDAPISERVIRNVERVCRFLDDHHVKGTFFIQGRVAETFPDMLVDLLAEGHEIQSHGYSHRPLYEMDRAALRDELERAKKTVEDACGVSVTAFRAPDFSILPSNLWALETLAELGFEVDSSIFPLKTRRYGVPGWGVAPRHVQFPNGDRIFEVPVAIGRIGPLNVPVAGGGYFRLLPRTILELAVRSILDENRPVVIYCHPYEFNPSEMNDYRGFVSPLYSLHQSIGRESMIGRMHRLLETFSFGRMDEVLVPWRVG